MDAASTPASLATIAQTRELVGLAAMSPEDEEFVLEALRVLTMYCEEQIYGPHQSPVEGPT